jgi:amidase
MSIEYWKLSAVELAEGIRDRRYSCVDAVTSVLERIRARNPELNAITVDCSADALIEAERADGAIGREEVLGELHGVPVTIKENVDQEGKATTNGMQAFADVIAPADAPVVRNLRKAGAIIVGRTNTPELSMRATTDNPLRGRTKNPWHPDASPGGSSGGAGVAAAAGFGPIHHGNDIGGSLRFPSFACGVTTVKPTQGRVPAFNPSAVAERGMLAQLMSVQGAICREVRDVRLATRVMAHGDPRDPWWAPVPFDTWPPAERPRIALTRENYGYPMHDDIDAALTRASDCLRDAGYAVDEVETPSILEPATAWFNVGVYEIQTTLGSIAQEHGSPALQKIFGWYFTIGDLVDANGYRTSIAERTRMTREWSVFLNRYPLVLSPFMMRPMFSWNYDEQSEANVHDLFRSSIYSVAVNYLGLPAGVVPAGRAAGLPAGVQIIGRRFREDLILDAMEAIESRLGVMAKSLWSNL